MHRHIFFKVMVAMAFLPWLRITGLSGDAYLNFRSAIFRDESPDFFNVIFEDASPNLIQAKIWLTFFDMFFSVLVCNACVMAENNIGRVRLRRASQTASVRRERDEAKTTRPQVDDNSFDGSQPSTSQHRGS